MWKWVKNKNGLLLVSHKQPIFSHPSGHHDDVRRTSASIRSTRSLSPSSLSSSSRMEESVPSIVPFFCAPFHSFMLSNLQLKCNSTDVYIGFMNKHHRQQHPLHVFCHLTVSSVLATSDNNLLWKILVKYYIDFVVNGVA